MLRDPERAFKHVSARRARYPRFRHRAGNASVRFTLDQRRCASAQVLACPTHACGGTGSEAEGAGGGARWVRPYRAAAPKALAGKRVRLRRYQRRQLAAQMRVQGLDPNPALPCGSAAGAVPKRARTREHIPRGCMG